MAYSDDDLDQQSNNLANQSAIQQANQNGQTAQNPFDAANEDFAESKKGGITKEQLDTLHKHEGANMWTSLFMNLVGATHGLDLSKNAEPLNKRVEQERQGLTLQNALAQQKAQNASQEQNFGLNQIKANQSLAEQQQQNAPLTEIQKSALPALLKLGKIDPSVDLSQIKTQRDYNNAVAGIEPIAKLQNSADAANLRGLSFGTNPVTGGPTIRDKRTQSITDVSNPNQNNIPTVNDITNGAAQEEPLKYNDLTSGRAVNRGLTVNENKNAIKAIPKLQENYQKTYGEPSIQFNNSYDNIKELVKESQEGNYKAANALAVQTAKMFEGLGKQRVTNQQINLENDPSASGAYNLLNQKLQGIVEGKGKVTPADAQNILDTAEGLKNIHDQALKKVKQQYKNQVQGIISQPFDDDKYLFGEDEKAQPKQQQNLQMNNNKDFNGIRTYNPNQKLSNEDFLSR